MPYEIREENGKFCLYKKDGGDSLGCHESRGDAMAQMRAIYANEAVQENLALADSDVTAGRRIFELDTGDPGFFTNCMSDSEMVERYGDEERRARVCAFLHKKITGVTPAEHESVQVKENFANERATLAVSLSPADKTGRTWEVTILGPRTPADLVTIDGVSYVRSRNDRLYSTAALEAAAPMFEGAKVYDDHLTDAEFQQRGGLRSVAKEWLGSLKGVTWDRATNSLKGVLKVVDDRFAQKLLRAQESNVLDTIGLSIDVFQDGIVRRVGESLMQLVRKITKVNSVDAVGEPAAGGQFIRALESIVNGRATEMPEELMHQIEQLAAAIDASLLPDEVKSAMKAELDKAKGAPPAQEQAPGEASAEEVQSEIEQVEATVEQSELPEPVKAEVVEQLEEVKDTIEEAPAQEAILKARRQVEALGKLVKGQIRAHRRAVRKVNMGKTTQTQGGPAPAVAEAQRILDEAKRTSEAAKREADRILEAARIAQAHQVLETELAASGLSEPMRKLIRKQYAGRAFEAADLKATIEDYRQAAIEEDNQGQVTGHGGARPRVRVGVNEADQFTLGFVRRVWGPSGLRKFREALDMKWKDGAPVIGNGQDAASDPSFGLAVRAVEGWKNGGFSMSSVPLYSGLDEWYWDLTGGGDRTQADFFGEGRFSARALEANLNTGTLASIVKNAVNVLLAADYAVQEQWWSDIVEELDVDTYDTATLVRLFGVSALDIVPEGDAYTELDWEDEEETAAPVKRGNYVEVTLETFLRDKVKKLDTLPQRLSVAWHNTVADRVAQVFTTNTAAGPALSDSGALFNATAVTSAGGHANLLTAALSYSALNAAVIAMKKQTDQPLGAGRRLGNGNMPAYILTPVDLTSLAERIINTEKIPGGADNDNNPYYQKIKVLEVPVWTDANDWALIAKPAGVSPIKLIWLRGKRTPELFEAADEKAGALLTNDAIRYKVRQFGFEFSSTYRVAPVADWRSLHKSNVA